MIVVDTDILIWVLRNNVDVVNSFERAVVATKGNLLITPIQLAEIYAGIRKKEEGSVSEFLGQFGLIDITSAIGIRAGNFLNRYKKSCNISMADALIAAAAIEHNCSVWTLNKKHYPMIDDKSFALF